MATEVESIIVTCPRCGEDYASWQGVGLEDPGPDLCPRCGFIPSEDPRLYRDGPAEVFVGEEARADG